MEYHTEITTKYGWDWRAGLPQILLLLLVVLAGYGTWRALQCFRGWALVGWILICWLPPQHFPKPEVGDEQASECRTYHLLRHRRFYNGEGCGHQRSKGRGSWCCR